MTAPARRRDGEPPAPRQEPADPAPPAHGPSNPRDLTFNPLSTGLGVFVAIAIPLAVVGYTRPSGVNGKLIILGVVIGLVAGILAGSWVASRGGKVWRGRQL